MNRSEAKKFWLKHAREFKEKGQSEGEVASSMGCTSISEYRSTLARYKEELRAEAFAEAVQTLRTGTTDTSFLDVGFGASRLLGITQDRLRTALAVLKSEGYTVHTTLVAQKDSDMENKVTVKVLCPPGTTYADVVANKNLIKPIKKEETSG